MILEYDLKGYSPLKTKCEDPSSFYPFYSLSIAPSSGSKSVSVTMPLTLLNQTFALAFNYRVIHPLSTISGTKPKLIAGGDVEVC